MKNLNIIQIYFLLFLLFGCVEKSLSQNCHIRNHLLLRKSIVASLGEDWYKKFSSERENGFYAKVFTDATGKIIDLDSFGFYGGITKKELKKCFTTLKQKFQLCVKNPDPHFTFEKFVELNKGKIPYNFRYFPFKVEKMLERLKK